jgi:hypothetical protein
MVSDYTLYTAVVSQTGSPIPASAVAPLPMYILLVLPVHFVHIILSIFFKFLFGLYSVLSHVHCFSLRILSESYSLTLHT